MLTPDITPVLATPPALALPEINAEPKKLPPVEKPAQLAKQEAESKREPAKEFEKKNPEAVDSKTIQLNSRFSGKGSELSIGMDKTTKKIVVKIVDAETKEVIRQIPPEELVQLAERLQKLQGASEQSIQELREMLDGKMQDLNGALLNEVV